MDAETLRRLEPIGALPLSRLEELAALCEPETYPIGSNVMALGGLGGQFLYLLSGELRIDLHDGSRRVLVGACDGANWPIGYKTVLPVSSKAITEISIVRIQFETLDIMMTWEELTSLLQPAAVAASKELAQGLECTGAFSLQALNSSSLAQFPVTHIHEVLQRFERILAKRGQVIVREGEPGDYYYLIESGRCNVIKRVGGADVQLAELKSGDAFGEEALVANVPRNATVNMKTDGVLLRLTKPDFVQLMQVPLLQGLSLPEAVERVSTGKARWLDVRYSAELTQGGLPGALNIPFSEIRGAFDLLDTACEYIVYCQTGRHSSATAFLLAQHGFTAYWLVGGVAGHE
jgi:CRP-like cAMP-binding protein